MVTFSVIKEASVDRNVEAVAVGSAYTIAVLRSAVTHRHRVAITTGWSQRNEHDG